MASIANLRGNRAINSFLMRGSIATMVGGAATMGAVGIASALGPPEQSNPWGIYKGVTMAQNIGIGAIAGGAIGGIASRSLIGLGIGAAVGGGIGLMRGVWKNAQLSAGAYTGDRQGSMAPQTRMSGSLGNIAQLRSDIARLHRPIKGSGW